MAGGAGNDTYYYGFGAPTSWSLALFGNDTVYGDNNADVLFGGDGADSLFGGAGNDILIGGTGLDSLYGEDGDDVIMIGGSSPASYNALIASVLGFF